MEKERKELEWQVLAHNLTALLFQPDIDEHHRESVVTLLLWLSERRAVGPVPYPVSGESRGTGDRPKGQRPA